MTWLSIQYQAWSWPGKAPSVHDTSQIKTWSVHQVLQVLQVLQVHLRPVFAAPVRHLRSRRGRRVRGGSSQYRCHFDLSAWRFGCSTTVDDSTMWFCSWHVFTLRIIYFSCGSVHDSAISWCLFVPGFKTRILRIIFKEIWARILQSQIRAHSNTVSSQ